jgi:RNA polymerase sigma factor (sigma-70 family)
MNDDEGPAAGNVSLAVCCEVARALIEKYYWTLMSEAELGTTLLKASRVAAPPVNLAQLAMEQYNLALYEACRQTSDRARCERAYTELARYLQRVAYSRWPDLAETVAQRALELVYLKIAECRHPSKFLAFAAFKLWQAFKEETRERDKAGLSLESLLAEDKKQLHLSEIQVVLQSDLLKQEQCRILVEAIRRLPNRREQKVMLLKFFGGLSGRAIANRLEIEENLVRQLSHRALQRLRHDEQLREYVMVEEEE